MSLTNNTKWLAIQYQNTNVQSLLTNVSQVQETELVNPLSGFESKLDLSTTDGIWLDYWGYRLGIFLRPILSVLRFPYFGFKDSGAVAFDQAAFFSVGNEEGLPMTDTEYREILKNKVQQLITDCSAENIRAILLINFEQVIVVDNQNMTVTITIQTVRPYNDVKALIDNGIVPKAAAVGYDVQAVIDNETFFSFEGGGGNGFDQGSFIPEFQV